MSSHGHLPVAATPWCDLIENPRRRRSPPHRQFGIEVAGASAIEAFAASTAAREVWAGIRPAEPQMQKTLQAQERVQGLDVANGPWLSGAMPGADRRAPTDRGGAPAEPTQ